MKDLRFYQAEYDSGLSLNAICKKHPEAKRFFLQKNLMMRSRSEGTSLSQLGVGLSQAHCDAISNGMRRYFEENPDEIPYRKYHSSKRSYPEVQIASGLERRGIAGWEEQFRVGVYTLDFAFVDIKLDVEIDGSTHLQPHVIEIDRRRDVFLTSLGWKILRIEAKRVKHNLEACLDLIEEHVAC